MVTDPGMSWGSGVTDPDRLHVRQIRDGAPVVHEVQGRRVGFAVCGAWLGDDCPAPEDAGERTACSTCLDMLDRGESIDWER